MKSSWQVGVVVLTLAGLSGCAGTQQRGRSSSPMEGLSVQEPGRPGWPTRLFTWRFAAAEPRVETARRTTPRPSAPETDIWPDRSRNILSRLLTAFPTSRSRGTGTGSSFLSRRESPSAVKLTAAEANEAIARAVRPRPRPATVPPTRDASVLVTQGETPAEEQTTVAEFDAPPPLSTPIPLPDLDADADAATDDAAETDADAILTQAPPPPSLRPTPRPVEPKADEIIPAAEPIDTKPALEPEPAKPAETPEPEPKPLTPAEPEPAPVKPTETPTSEPSAKPAETPASEPSAKPAETPTTEPSAEPAETPTTEPSAEPAPMGESAAPVAQTAPVWESQFGPIVAPAPQVVFDSPEPAMVGVAAASAPHQHAAPRRWSFLKWKKSPSHRGGSPVQAPAQLPPVQFPTSYDSIAARPLSPCPDHARVVTPTAQQQIVIPSAQTVAVAPAEKCARIKALGARLHDKLDRLRAWKHEHICKRLQSFKAALFGGHCPTCGGHGAVIAAPLASPQAAPTLAGSRFGLY